MNEFYELHANQTQSSPTSFPGSRELAVFVPTLLSNITYHCGVLSSARAIRWLDNKNRKLYEYFHDVSPQTALDPPDWTHFYSVNAFAVGLILKQKGKRQLENSHYNSSNLEIKKGIKTRLSESALTRMCCLLSSPRWTTLPLCTVSYNSRFSVEVKA